MWSKVKTCRWVGRMLAIAGLLAIPLGASATFNPKDMLTYKPYGNGEAFIRFAPTDTPATVEELGPFAVVNYGKGPRCPAGGFYLVNTKRRSYQFIDSGTCGKTLTVSLSDAGDDPSSSAVTHVLTFIHHGEIVARYPLYGY